MAPARIEDDEIDSILYYPEGMEECSDTGSHQPPAREVSRQGLLGGNNPLPVPYRLFVLLVETPYDWWYSRNRASSQHYIPGGYAHISDKPR